MTGKSGIYAASCNPPRTAKQQRQRSFSESSSASEYNPEPRTVVPLSPKLAKPPMDSEASTSGAKRGRKPATMSRTAREAQRKLNHSIIEKARRTKINDALATLRQLVPSNYGQQQSSHQDDEDGADGDFDASKKPKKAPGKREEKEKEFKLEILVRTVSFMQDLIQRVSVLEEAARTNQCANCVTEPSSLKRKRSVDVAEGESRLLKRHEPVPGPATPSPSPSLNPSASPLLAQSNYTGARLPPISAWLPEIDPALRASASPSLRSIRPSASASPEFHSHLPSPPASTQFAPARAPVQLPPALSLDPIATQALLSARTPEDESAASLLLEISASSPTFNEPPSSANHPGPKFPVAPRQVQTPASLLGIMAKR